MCVVKLADHGFQYCNGMRCKNICCTSEYSNTGYYLYSCLLPAVNRQAQSPRQGNRKSIKEKIRELQVLPVVPVLLIGMQSRCWVLSFAGRNGQRVCFTSSSASKSNFSSRSIIPTAFEIYVTIVNKN